MVKDKVDGPIPSDTKFFAISLVYPVFQFLLPELSCISGRDPEQTFPPNWKGKERTFVCFKLLRCSLAYFLGHLKHSLQTLSLAEMV